MTNPQPPSFLSDPTPMQQLYHGTRVDMWKGTVRLTNVQGWADNPRLEMEMKKWQKAFPGPINQDELYKMMQTTREFRLKELKDNILINGLRKPIVLAFDGRLLDGNRRFFAIKFAHDETKDLTKQRDLEMIPALVLMQNASKQDEENILVEENFSKSLKIEWPDHVKARRIWKAYDEEKMKRTEIAKRYGWTPYKVRETLRTWEIAEKFINYSMTEPDHESERGGLGLSMEEAEEAAFAGNNYQFFNEAQKSYFKQLNEEPEFAVLFYNLICKRGFFSNFPEVRCAYEGYKDKENCLPLMRKGEPGGGSKVRLHVQTIKEGLVTIKSVQETFSEFHDYLNNLTTEDKKAISGEVLEKLRDTLRLVESMVQAANAQK